MAQNETHLCNEERKNVHIRITLPGEEVISIPVTPVQETSSVIKVIQLTIVIWSNLINCYFTNCRGLHSM